MNKVLDMVKPIWIIKEDVDLSRTEPNAMLQLFPYIIALLLAFSLFWLVVEILDWEKRQLSRKIKIKPLVSLECSFWLHRFCEWTHCQCSCHRRKDK